jgi:hypothetical protein
MAAPCLAFNDCLCLPRLVYRRAALPIEQPALIGRAAIGGIQELGRSAWLASPVHTPPALYWGAHYGGGFADGVHMLGCLFGDVQGDGSQVAPPWDVEALGVVRGGHA